jgi:hypothetical protein
MTSRNRRIALAVAVLATVSLTGCEKPYPGVTVWSGTTSEHVQALCWQPNAAAALSAKECAQDTLEQAAGGAQLTPITVAPGNTVGVSVDPVVAENGWGITVAGSELVTGLTDTYYRFTFPEQGASSQTGYPLQVTATGMGGGARGYWFVKLVPSAFAG